MVNFSGLVGKGMNKELRRCVWSRIIGEGDDRKIQFSKVDREILAYNV